MAWKYEFSKANRETLQTLEDERESPLLFDMDREMVAAISGKMNVKQLVQGLAGKPEKEIEAAFERFGVDLMDLTVELADGKFLDRTGEILQLVAKQTGLHFPHEPQRYVELSVIGARPFDQWNIVESTTTKLVFQVYRCSVLQAQEEAGVETKNLPCKGLCLASFARAGERAQAPCDVTMTKKLPADGMCEFCLMPK